MSVQVERYRFTVDEFRRMAESGLFLEQPRVELVDGEVIQMTPIGRRHALCVGFLTEWLAPRLAGRALLLPQVSIRLAPRTECPPDLLLVRPPRSAYRDADFRPGDVLLLVEVAETSLGYDREIKIPLYASAGIHEVWVVDLVSEAVEAYRGPAGERYADVQRVGRGGTLAPAAFPDLTVPIADLLG